jgi:predicted nuclease of predicted toxin-antitoxin system
MRLLLDENVSRRRLVILLREAGHDVATVAQILTGGATDPIVGAAALREDRVLCTADCDDFRRIYAVH